MQSTRREALDELLDFVGHPDDAGARNTAEVTCAAYPGAPAATWCPSEGTFQAAFAVVYRH